MLGLLLDRKDLGIHSEMVPDSVVDLVKAGVITGDRETMHPHKVIAGFVLGSKVPRPAQRRRLSGKHAVCADTRPRNFSFERYASGARR